MQDRRTEAHLPRVVALVGEIPAPGLREDTLRADGVEVVRVPGAYEAAAELLAAPTAGLVIDLRLLLERHARLLEVARRMEVAILAVGPVPAGLDATMLRGVTFLSPGELGEAIDRAAQSQAEAPVELRPAKGRSGSTAAGPPAEDETRGRFRPTPADEDPATGRGENRARQADDGGGPRAESVLTPEEISALLESEH